jgi:hypothetical protein
MFFIAADSAAEQELIRGSELGVLESLCGHIGLFGMDSHIDSKRTPRWCNCRPGRPIRLGKITRSRWIGRWQPSWIATMRHG